MQHYSKYISNCIAMGKNYSKANSNIMKPIRIATLIHFFFIKCTNRVSYISSLTLALCASPLNVT